MHLQIHQSHQQPNLTKHTAMAVTTVTPPPLQSGAAAEPNPAQALQQPGSVGHSCHGDVEPPQ